MHEDTRLEKKNPSLHTPHFHVKMQYVKITKEIKCIPIKHWTIYFQTLLGNQENDPNYKMNIKKNGWFAIKQRFINKKLLPKCTKMHMHTFRT